MVPKTTLTDSKGALQFSQQSLYKELQHGGKPVQIRSFDRVLHVP